jgi:hypothetical protein
MRTRTKMLDHTDAWCGSRLSQKEYCDERGISCSTFSDYRTRQLRGEEGSHTSTSGFLPVRIANFPVTVAV